MEYIPAVMNPHQRLMPMAWTQVQICPRCSKDFAIGEGVVYDAHQVIKNEIHLNTIFICSLDCLLQGLYPEGTA